MIEIAKRLVGFLLRLNPLLVVTDSLKAQSIVAYRQLKLREKAMSASAKIKLEDLNTHLVESAARSIAGTARSMGIEVTD